MDKEKIIKQYLLLSSKYAHDFFSYYKLRKSGMKKGVLFSPHGNGLKITDKLNNLELDFDFFHYDGKNIKYFDVWKLNNFSKPNYDFEFSKEVIEQLESSGIIKKYHKSPYYSLNIHTTKFKNML